jgi:hypothetical protein
MLRLTFPMRAIHMIVLGGPRQRKQKTHLLTSLCVGLNC